MNKRHIAWILATILLLNGCRSQAPAILPSPIVRQIVATEESSHYFLRRFYHTNEKMQAVLLCIRMLRPKFSADTDVETLKKPTLCITMTCSDGSRKLYRLKDIQYLQIDAGPWKKVDGSAAANLWRLLWEMESDAESARSFHTPLPRLRGNWVYPYGHRTFP